MKTTLTLDFDESLENHLAQEYPDITGYRILSKSLDARLANKGKKPRYLYTLELFDQTNASEQSNSESFQHFGALKQKPIIIGAGPAGLFCALRLAEYGVSSIIIERGDRAHERMKKISRFWRHGDFDKDNNVCYGEGGAGLFSDGKLITRVKSPYIKYVMKKFVDFGAPAEIAYLSNPHLGSNKIRMLINKISSDLISSGCEIYYNNKVETLKFEGNQCVGVGLKSGETLTSNNIILATGHSSVEMYQHLVEQKVSMQLKDFAVGVRIEHPRKEIDQIQHGDFSESPVLGAAKYRLAFHDNQSKKGTYSFCMCPGGYVLSSGTQSEGIVVNGMSNFARNSPWSNSAIVVSVNSGTDFKETDLLAGQRFQQEIEFKAKKLSDKYADGKSVPFQGVSDFLSDELKTKTHKSSCPSGIFSVPMQEIFPEFVTTHLKNALKIFNDKMPGFISSNAIILAPETRTSAPVTILRDKQTLESLSHVGLYPCGEGAGHAGGITSAAVDGIKVAEALISKSYKR